MSKIFMGACLAATLLVGPALAQTAQQMMDCNEANMKKMEMDVQKMNNGEKKTMAMREMTTAKAMMTKKDMAMCKTHMNNAMKQAM